MLTLETKEQNFYFIVIPPTLEVKTSKAISLNSDRHLAPSTPSRLYGNTSTTKVFQFYLDKKSEVKDSKNQNAEETNQF